MTERNARYARRGHGMTKKDRGAIKIDSRAAKAGTKTRQNKKKRNIAAGPIPFHCRSTSSRLLATQL